LPAVNPPVCADGLVVGHPRVVRSPDVFGGEVNPKHAGESQGQPSEGRERIIGSHSVRFEPPDILFLRLTGDVEEAHVMPIMEEFGRYAEELPYLYGLVDMVRMGSITPAARKASALAKNPENSAVVLFSASFTHRVIVKLVLKAAQIFSASTQPTAMFGTEAEARAWIEEQRRARSQGAST
jgi:hypothetical protein